MGGKTFPNKGAKHKKKESIKDQEYTQMLILGVKPKLYGKNVSNAKSSLRRSFPL